MSQGVLAGQIKGKGMLNSISCRSSVLLLAALFASNAFAQSTTSLSGIVTDPSGAAVAGASIQLNNTDTSLRRDVKSSGDGSYNFVAVPPGTYKVTASASGFANQSIDRIQLLVNTPATMTIKLEVGTITETISVTAEALQVNTSDASLGNAIGNKPILQLPFFARNIVGLLGLQPGVTAFNTSITDERNGAVNGGKADQANVTLDGIDVNSQQERYAFTSALRVTLDSVQEFRTVTANANADSGRSSGAQVTLVTKSGTNDYHGSAYWNHRNTATAAADFFDNLSGIGRRKLLINNYGASFGGAVIKNRVFYFFNYEGRKDASRQSVTRTVPSDLLRQGIVQYRTTTGEVKQLSPADVKTKVDPAGIGANAAVLDIFKKYPLANDFTLGDGLNTQGYRFNAPITGKQDTYITRWDAVLDSANKHTLFFRGNLQNDRSLGTPQFSGAQANRVELDDSRGYGLGLTSLVRPNFISQFRFGLTRQGTETTGIQSAAAVSFRSIDDPFGLTRETARIIPTYNVNQDFSWIKQRHEVKFGANMWFVSNASRSTANSFSSASTNSSWLRGSGSDLQAGIPDLNRTFRVAYNDAAMALLGIVSQVNNQFNFDTAGASLAQGSPILRTFKSEQYEIFGQDTWKVSRGLTVTYGLRYVMAPPVYEGNGYQTSGNPSVSDWFNQRAILMGQGKSQLEAGRIKYVLANSATGAPLYPDHKQNFAPRVSLAYSPQGNDGLSKFLFGGTGRTSVRAGFGVFHDILGQSLIRTADSTLFGFSSQLRNPAGTLTATTAPRFSGLTSLPASLIVATPKGGFPAVQPDNQAITNYIDDKLNTPYSMAMNFSVGREFKGGLFVQASYVGRLSRRSLINRDLAMPTNIKDPASGQTYFEGATQLALLDRAKTKIGDVKPIPFWENMYPGLKTGTKSATQAAYEVYQSYAPDYTSALYDLDVGCDPGCSKLGQYAFFSPQFSALSAWSSIGSGAYHAMQWTVRKRFASGLTADFNYSLAKSIDLASRAERVGAFGGFLVNTWNTSQRRAVSDYDVRHAVNGFLIYELPVGRNKKFLTNAGGFVNAILGGWQLSATYQQSSGLPTSVGNGRNWPTNWNVTGFATPSGPQPATATSKNAPAVAGKSGPNLFANPTSALAAYDFTLPGQSGQRNVLRGDGGLAVNTGLGKKFVMPYSEKHSLQLRWETFNITNTVRFDVNSLTLDLGNTGSFGKYSSTLNSPRQMQFLLRYDF